MGPSLVYRIFFTVLIHVSPLQLTESLIYIFRSFPVINDYLIEELVDSYSALAGDMPRAADFRPTICRSVYRKRGGLSI